MCGFPRERRANRGDRALIPGARLSRVRGAAGGHSRARLGRRAAGANGLRVRAKPDGNFVMVMHGVPATCTASFAHKFLSL